MLKTTKCQTEEKPNGRGYWPEGGEKRAVNPSLLEEKLRYLCTLYIILLKWIE